MASTTQSIQQVNANTNLVTSAVDTAKSLIMGGNGQYSLMEFIEKLNQYGYNTRSRFECSFSLIPCLTFFITGISTPGIRREFTQIYLDGRVVDVPTIIEYDREGLTMTVLNDEKGAIYTGFVQALRSNDALNGLISIQIKTFGDNTQNSDGGGILGKVTSTLSKLTSGGGNDGMILNMSGVRIMDISGLDFSSTDSDLQTFTVRFKIVSWSVSPANIMDTLMTNVGAIGGSALAETGLGNFL